jgi:hypothetical protein
MRVELENAGRGSKMRVGVQRCELGLGNAQWGSEMAVVGLDRTHKDSQRLNTPNKTHRAQGMSTGRQNK